MERYLKNKMLCLSSSSAVRRLFIGFCTTFLTCSALANPVVDNVAAGNVSIQQSSGSTVVNQSSQKAIINWQSFNIGASESTHFQQPASGMALNRISPTQGVSSIYGSLTATGQIILVNPAGIYFGPSAFVNVGGLIATTHDITDANFLSGNFTFNKVDPYSGAIVNEGTIVAAQHGLVALVAPSVVNNGMIQTSMGKVVLASGDAFTMSFDGNGLVNFVVDQKTSSRGVDRNGNQLPDGVKNTGAIYADGGSVLITAKAASGVLDKVVNMEGVAQARSVGQVNGEIILSGETDINNDAVVRVAGKLDASGKRVGEKGGKVQVTSKYILVDDGANIDVSGDVGGGDIFIGGNYQGKGPLSNATAVAMLPNTNINANAITNGNGGQVILWSDEFTNILGGNISARGGVQSGNGGFVETSSKNTLNIDTILVDAAAPVGHAGQWLLDPWDVTISTAANANPNTFANPFNATGTGSNVNTTSLQNALASADVSVTTGSTGGESGDITVSDSITWTSTFKLSLTAANDIIINAAISGVNGSLELSAVDAANSITTGASGTISVANFNLLQGRWSQDGTLPSFSVTNNFQIASGAADPSNVEFLRVTGGNGNGSPYQIVDVFGLQGMNSSSTLKTDNFQLNGDIDATVTSNWNSGTGFIPIGNSTTNFTGSLDGQFNTISNLYENTSSNINMGLFGVTNAATISNLILSNAFVKNTGTSGLSMGSLVGNATGATAISTVLTVSPTVSYNAALTGGLNIGGLVGILNNASATISQSSTEGGTVTATFSGGTPDGINLGGLVGNTLGNVSNSSSTASVIESGTASNIHAGGLIGDLTSGTTTNTFSTGYVSSGGGGNVGGLVGRNVAGSFVASYYNNQTSSTGATGVGTGTATNVSGLTTAQMMNSSNFSGWDFTSPWSIISGTSFPYLNTIYTSAPRVISTTLSSATGNLKNNLVSDGTSINNFYSGANGFVYFLEQNGIIADSSNLLIYLDTNGGTVGNLVLAAPTSGGSATGLALTVNALTLDTSNASIGNAALVSAKGSISDTDILYTYSGNDITLTANKNFVATTTGSANAFALGGNMTTSGTGTITATAIPTTLSATSILTSATDIDLAAVSLGSNNLTVSAGGAGNTITGTISGTGALTKSGSGTLTLSGTNAYSGATTINAGTLSIGFDINLGTAPIIATPGQLTLNGGTLLNSNTMTLDANRGIALGASGGTFDTNGTFLDYSGIIAGSGALTKINSGILTLTGINTYSGSTTINSGRISIDADSGLGTAPGSPTAASIVLNNGFLTTTTGFTLNANRGISLGASGGFFDTTGTLIYNGIIAGSGSLTKISSGTLQLGGVNTYTGTTTISAGSLSIAADSGLGTAPGSPTIGRLTINGGTLQTTAGFTLNANRGMTLGASGATFDTTGTLIYNGIIAGSGALTKTSSGTLEIGGVNTYSGATTVNAGILRLDNAGALNGTSGTTVNNDTTLLLNFSGTLGNTNTISLNSNNSSLGALNLSGATINSPVSLLANTNIGGSGTIGNTISGNFNLTKITSGTLTLSAANSYTGSTTISTGTIANGINNALPTSTALSVSGTLDTSNFSQQVASVTGSGTVTNSGGTAGTFTINNSGSDSFAGSITGNLALTKSAAGTLTLSNANSYTGATTISAGTLQLGTTDAIINSSAVTLANVAGAILDLNNNNNSINTLSGGGNLGGNITLGTATLTVTQGSVQTYAGVISGSGGSLVKTGVSDLTLAGNNTFDGGLTLSAGTLTLGHNNALGTGTLALNGGTLQSNATRSISNIFTVGGSAVIGGSSNINLLGIGTLNSGLTLSSSATTSLQGVIGGAAGLTQSSGIVILAGNNTYSGAILVNGGTMNVDSDAGLGTTAAGTTVGSGATLAINGVNVGNEAITLNNATLASTGTASLAGAITLSSSPTISSTGTFTLGGNINGAATLALQGAGAFVINGNIGNSIALSNFTSSTATSFNGTNSINSTGIIAFNNTLDGASDLSLTSGGTTTFGGIVGGATALNSLTINANNINVDGGTITTVNNQTYNGTVSAGAGGANLITTSAGNTTLAFNNGISGSNNISIDTNPGGNNTLLMNSGSTQNWMITATNSGSINGISGFTGLFDFNNIHNLIGGNTGNTFNFANNATISGNINGGTLSPTQVYLNTFDFSAYASPVTVNMPSNIFAGSVKNNLGGTISAYSNIDNLIANGNVANLFTVPSGKSVTVTGTVNPTVGTKSGFIGDPTYFYGFVYNGPTPSPAPTPPSTPIDVAQIMQQPIINANDNANVFSSGGFVGQNVTEIANQADQAYLDYINSIKINPFCGRAT